ncbi:endonuclease III domain-containing protein [Nanoarchaeota archaeon]
MKNIIKILKVLEKTQGKTMLATFNKLPHFQILIATILSARSKDEVTEVISRKLFKVYPTAKKLSKADPKDVKKIIKPIGFYNNKTKMIINASKQIVNEFGGVVPDKMDELLKISGVGRKVANCVLVYAHGISAIPVDTHVHRISNRLGLVKTKIPDKTEIELEKIVPKKYWLILNDVFVMHGKTICKPIGPMCSDCPIEKCCRFEDKRFK